MALQNSGNGYFTTGVTNLPIINGNKTVSFWFKVSSTPGGNALCFNLISTAGAGAIQIGYRTNVLGTYGWGGNTFVAAAVNPSNGVLNLFTYTYDGTTHTLYLNGTYSNSTSTAAQTGTPNSMELFGNQWTENITILMEDIRIYNRDISAAEVSTIYACRGHDCILSGLASRWTLNEGASGTSPALVSNIKDQSLNGNNGLAVPAGLLSGYQYQDSQLTYLTNRNSSWQ